MSTFAEDLFATVVDLAGGAWGARVSATIKRPHALKTTGGVAPALEVAAAASAGASTVSLRTVRVAPSTPLALGGTVPAGIALTIAATAYTVTAPAQAAANVLVLEISPELAAGVSIADPVTLAGSVTFDLGECLKHGVFSRLTPDLAERASYELLVPAGATRPRLGDLLTVAGEVGSVVMVDDAGGGWAVQVGPG